MTISWTEERISTLTRMWESGATASQIAEELGGVSRNAVIGKAHRLGLKARPSPVKANEARSSEGNSHGAKSNDSGATEASETEARYRSRQAAPPPHPASEPAEAQAERGSSESLEMDVAATPLEQQQAAPEQAAPLASPPSPRVVSVGPGGFLRQGPGDQQAPIPAAPPRRLVPARPSADIVGKTSLLDLNDRVCRWPMGHPGEADFHFCGDKVNPGFPYCVAHCGRAYQAQLPRGARRPPPPLPFGGPRVR